MKKIFVIRFVPRITVLALALFLFLPFIPKTSAATTQNFGSKYVFNSSWSIQIGTCTLSSSKYVIVFRDEGHSGRGVAMVANVSGRTITYGPQTIFDTDESSYMSCVVINSSHFSIAYSDGGNSDRGTIITGTIGGGDVITFTGGNAFSTGVSGMFSIALLNYDAGSDTGWLVVAYSEGNTGGNGTSSIVSVVGNGTVTTIGAPVEFNAATTYWPEVQALSSNSFLVVFTDHGNSDHGTAMAATVAGYVPTFGAELEFNNSFTSCSNLAIFSSTKAVVGYSADGAPMHGRSRVLSVAGTVVSAGAVANIENTARVDVADIIALDSGSFMVAYTNEDLSNATLVREGAVSGTDITYDTQHFYSYPNLGLDSLTFLTATKFAVSFCDLSNSWYGTSMVADLPIFLHPIGSLVQVTSPYAPADAHVYLVTDTYENGHIPNATVFTSQFSWAKIVPISYSESVDYSEDYGYIPYRNCELVKEPRTAEVYVFENRQKRLITTETVFLQYGFSWSNIISVPDWSLLDYATGAPLNAYADTTYPSGCLLKPNNLSNVYMIDAGNKRLVPNANVYLSRFLSWSKVISVDPSVLSDVNYPVGTTLPYRDGELVKETSSPAVYVFENELKRHILDPTTFETYNYSWSNILTVQDGSLAVYGNGADISL